MKDWEEWFRRCGDDIFHTVAHGSYDNEDMYQAFKARMEHENKPTRKAKPKEYTQFEDDLFTGFWCAGMAKVGDKEKTKAKYITLCNKRTGHNTPLEFHKMILLDIFKRIKANQFGFDTLHPYTYLNGERWNDEIIKVKPKTIKLPKDIVEVEVIAIYNGVRAANPGEEPWDYRTFVKSEFAEKGI